MKAVFWVSCSAVAVILALSLSSTSAVGLQLVAPLNPALGVPANGNGDSWAPITSPDGRYILFASTADNLVATSSSNGIPRLNPPSINVFLRDRVEGTTTLVSMNLAGVGGNGNSFPTGISSNGQFALFESAASDLVASDTNGVNDIFLRDMVNGVTRLVSVATNGTSGDGDSRDSMLTPDGRFVAFVSAASNLTPGDTNGIADAFVGDMQAGVTTLVSVGAVSTGSGSSSESPEITPDGRCVAFSSTAINLVPGVTNSGEIYVRDLQAGTTTWASTNARAISHVGMNGFCYSQAISDDGRFVAFEISSNAIGIVGTNGFVLRCDLQTGQTDKVSTNAACPFGAVQDMRSLELSPDGRFIAYVANSAGNGSSVFLWDAESATNILVSANLSNGITSGVNAYCPDLDATGRHVVFYSSDTNLTANAGAGIFVRDVEAGTTTLVSVDTNGSPLAVDPTAVPAFSGGNTVAFESPWEDLDGRNFECDVFACDLTNAGSELISVHDPILPSVAPNGPCELWPGSVSANGRFVAFSSLANNLSLNDTNGCEDVFVRDLVTTSMILVSAATNGFSGSGFSTEPAMSGDGRYVAFTSAATNLVAGDSNQMSDVFIRDLQ
jgi:Tol biopolymer transport system component